MMEATQTDVLDQQPGNRQRWEAGLEAREAEEMRLSERR